MEIDLGGHLNENGRPFNAGSIKGMVAGMICYVTRYDPDSGAAPGEPQMVEADTRAEAAERVCGFKVVEGSPPGITVCSVMPQGEGPTQRRYYRKA